VLRIKNLFTPPVFEGEDDKTLVASSLHILLLAGLAVAAIAILVFFAISPRSLPRVLATDLPIVLILLAGWTLVRRGKVKLAAFLAVTIAWVAATVSSVLAGGLKSPLFGVGSMLVVLMGGFLIGQSGSFTMVFINIVTAIVLTYGETRGWIPDVPSSVTYGSILISYALNLLAAAAVMFVAISTIQKALMRARVDLAERTRAEHEVQQLNLKLEHQVREHEKLITDLENKNAELERFTYTVSHDLKSPLVTIRGFLGFLERDIQAGDPEKMKSDFTRISEATDKMQRLLNELLELSRIGRMMNPPQTIPFEAIVREAMEILHVHIEARGVQIEIAPDLPTVYGDRTRLVEVAQNLLDNAIKFMGTQSLPRIEIGFHARDEKNRPIFFIKDNGIGIEPQYQNTIFGLFNKLDPLGEGTGVGLALVKRIVEFHGGNIWVESAGLGQGSTFFVSLPDQKGE
jgi:signal transduction histidine kinase